MNWMVNILYKLRLIYEAPYNQRYNGYYFIYTSIKVPFSEVKEKMIKPINIKIIKRKGENWFRLHYKCGNTTVTTQGFSTKKELLKIIEDNELFEIDLHKIKQN